MSLKYPGFVAPQPYDQHPDIAGNFARSYAATRGVVDDIGAPDLMEQFYRRLGLQADPNAANPGLLDLASLAGARPQADAVMQPGHTAKPGSMVDQSITAANGATDMDLAQKLSARYPESNITNPQTPSSGVPETRVADTAPGAFLSDLIAYAPKQAPQAPQGALQPSPQMTAYADAVQQSESGGDPNAQNPSSTATGLFQFTEPTWASVAQAHPELDLSPDGMADPRQQRKAMMAFTSDNAKALKAAGIAVTPASLYASHFLGSGAAPQVLTASAETPMSQLVSPEVMQQNPTLADMTAGDFRDWASAQGTNTSSGGRGYRPPSVGPDGSAPTPSPQIDAGDISPELLKALASNSVTRPLVASLIQTRMAGLTADRYQTVKGDDGGLYQLNLKSGQVTPIKTGTGANTVRTVTDPAERSSLGIADDDKSLYQVDQTGALHKIGTDAGTSSDDAETIAQAIASGDQPPVLTGLYKLSGPVRASLAKKGYDLTKAQQDWTATSKLLSTLNGPGQVRLRQAVNQVSDSLPLIEQLADQWKGGQFPILNKANLVAAKNGVFGKDAQSLATQLDGEIADVAAELATVYRGGNTATDSALAQAEKQFSSDWSIDTLKNAIQLAKVNVSYRKNSLNLATAGVDTSAYNPMSEEPAGQPAVGPAGVTSATPTNTAAPALPDPMSLR